MIKIDKGVPLPDEKSAIRKYPLRELEIGDSFFVPNGKASSISSIMSRLKRDPGLTFTMRSVVESGDKGIRVWRVS